MIAAVVSAATLIVGIISIVPILTRDASRLDSLVVEARPTQIGEVISFGVPVDVSFDTFPDGDGDVCSAEQRAWLESAGQEIQLTYLVDARNVASEGALLSFRDVRASGEFTEPTAQAVLVECNVTGFAGNGKSALLPVDGHSVAYFDNSLVGTSSEGMPDTPIIYNLAPGESGQFTIRLMPTMDFHGTLVMSVASGKEQADVTMEISENPTISVPGLLMPGGAYLSIANGSLQCVTPGLRADAPVISETCGLSDLIGGS